MWSLPHLPLLRRRRPPAPEVIELDEAAIIRQMVDVLRVAGYQVHETGRERWHERVSVDYGNGFCLTSAPMAFDHLMRQLERAMETRP